jgi:hypothetical protein
MACYGDSFTYLAFSDKIGETHTTKKIESKDMKIESTRTY